MRILIFLPFFLWAAQFCYAQVGTGLIELPPKDLENTIFIIPGGKELKIQSDTRNGVSHVTIGSRGNFVRLKFFIMPDVTTSAYYLKDDSREIIVLESYLPEPTGLAANIINLSFLMIRGDSILKAEFSNSFFKGIDSMQIEDGLIHVRVLKFVKYINDYNPVCCKYEFILSKSFQFERSGNPHCVVYNSTDGGAKSDGNCAALDKPVIFDY